MTNFEPLFNIFSGVYIVAYSPPPGGGEIYQEQKQMGKEIKLRREEKKGKERGRKKKEKKKKKKGKKGRGLGKKIKRGGEENQDSCNYIHA